MALRKRSCASAKASAVHSIATALVLNDFTKIKRAFGVLPNLRAAFDLRSARIRVVDHRLWKAVSDQVINEAHQQKLEAASSRGTSIRYVERLLRDGERFYPSEGVFGWLGSSTAKGTACTNLQPWRSNFANTGLPSFRRVVRASWPRTSC
jgi:hypothetical protein